MVLRRHIKKESNYISTTRVAVTPTLIITYLDGLLPIKSQDLLITWFCEIV